MKRGPAGLYELSGNWPGGSACWWSPVLKVHFVLFVVYISILWLAVNLLLPRKYFIMGTDILTAWKWINDGKLFCLCKLNCISTHFFFTQWRISITKTWYILTNAIFSPNVHWRANQTRSWLLKTMTFRTVWIYQLIGQRLSLPSYNTHPTWLSFTNELKFDDELDQINSLSLVNLLLLIKLSFICEGQPYIGSI